MNYLLNVKSSSIVHTLLSNCVKLLGKVQKLLIKCISYSVISKQIRVVSPKFYIVRKNFTGPPAPPVPTNLKSALIFTESGQARTLVWSLLLSAFFHLWLKLFLSICLLAPKLQLKQRRCVFGASASASAKVHNNSGTIAPSAPLPCTMCNSATSSNTQVVQLIHLYNALRLSFVLDRV